MKLIALNGIMPIMSCCPAARFVFDATARLPRLVVDLLRTCSRLGSKLVHLLRISCIPVTCISCIYSSLDKAVVFHCRTVFPFTNDSFSDTLYCSAFSHIPTESFRWDLATDPPTQSDDKITLDTQEMCCCMACSVQSMHSVSPESDSVR